MTGYIIIQVQFWIVTFHISYTIYAGCGYPDGYAWLLVIYMFTQKALFMNFYMKTYNKKSSTKPLKPSTEDQNGNIRANGTEQNGKID